MKQVIGFLVVIAAASFTADARATPAEAAPAHKATKPAAAKSTAKAKFADLAPADEYFGPLKLSILGVRNTIRDLGRRYDVNHDIAAQTISSAALTEAALHDWEHKYPRDSEIPRQVYFLERLYARIETPDGHVKAVATETWLFHDFARSPQAKQLKKTLAYERAHPKASPTPADDMNGTPPPYPAPLLPGSPASAPPAYPAYPAASPVPSSNPYGRFTTAPSAAPSPAAMSTGAPAPRATYPPYATPTATPTH